MFQPLVLSRRKQTGEKLRERTHEVVEGAKRTAKKVAKGAERIVEDIRERESRPRKFQPLVLSRRGPRDNPNVGVTRYENTSGKHNKFWEVSSVGSRLTMHWGRIGTKGQTKTKSFPTGRDATYAGLKMIQDKLDGGYHYVRAGQGAAARPAGKKAGTRRGKSSSGESHSLWVFLSSSASTDANWKKVSRAVGKSAEVAGSGTDMRSGERDTSWMFATKAGANSAAKRVRALRGFKKRVAVHS